MTHLYQNSLPLSTHFKKHKKPTLSDENKIINPDLPYLLMIQNGFSQSFTWDLKSPLAYREGKAFLL